MSNRLLLVDVDDPSVPSVWVTRCKDCKHRGDYNKCPMCFGGNDPEYDDDRTGDDGFCNEGEPKEEDPNHSPFPKGMSQAEYFGLTKEEEK